MISVEDSRNQRRRSFIILYMDLPTQLLVNAIWWKLFGSLEYFPGLAIVMMMVSLQEGGNS